MHSPKFLEWKYIELKSIVSEMKTSLDGSNSRLDMIKQRSVNMDGEGSIELIESEERKRKKGLEAKNSLWDNISGLTCM